MSEFLKEQKFIAYTVTNNGIYLWKSLMQERHRWLKHIRVDSELGIKQDPDMDKLLKSFFSRSTNHLEEREQRKILKTFTEKIQSYFKVKTPQAQLQVPQHIINIKCHIYGKVV